MVGKQISHFNLDRWKNLIELGVLNSNLPQDKGGLGMDQVTLALMVEEMGYAGLPEPVAEQTFLINDAIPFLPKNITEAIESNYNDGGQYIALAHPLAPNPLFLNDSAGLILLDNSECKFIAKDDMDFEVISSNDPSRELFKINLLIMLFAHVKILMKILPFQQDSINTRLLMDWLKKLDLSQFMF